jgi:hypothetical protein
MRVHYPIKIQIQDFQFAKKTHPKASIHTGPPCSSWLKSRTVILHSDAIKLLPTLSKKSLCQQHNIHLWCSVAKSDLELWLVWGGQSIVCTVKA